MGGGGGQFVKCILNTIFIVLNDNCHPIFNIPNHFYQYCTNVTRQTKKKYKFFIETIYECKHILYNNH